jgi:hypothetical protein
LTAEVTAKPTINSNQWQTPVDDEAARQAPRERQRTAENSVSHFWEKRYATPTSLLITQCHTFEESEEQTRSSLRNISTTSSSFPHTFGLLF